MRILSWCRCWWVTRAWLLETSYLRKKGQQALSQDTQQVNKSYCEPRTWMEIVNKPYPPSEAP